MADLTPNPELLRSLGRLARGLSCLFWGLPLALLSCTLSAVRAEWLRGMGVVPPVLTTGMLLFGLWEMGSFQRQERIWSSALWQARLLATVNFGLSPFLFFWSRAPGNEYFQVAAALFGVCSLAFLVSLNAAIERLGAMLPDETLRYETRQLTAVNRGLLLIMLLLVALRLAAAQSSWFAQQCAWVLDAADRFLLHRWLLIAFLLLPLAMTMALLWKTKEVILESVFGGRH